MNHIMKHFILLLLLLQAFGLKAQMIQPSNKANKTQVLLQKRGYGMFVHFGVNTFADMEWSDGTIPAKSYNPTQLDCDQWVRIAKEAGLRYVLLVTKHHDGFCLWDSKYTTYDVASSPVKTDVLKAVSDACKKYGLEFGVYYSLWDRYEPSYKDKDPEKYVDYMVNQLTEIFTNYGPICELWFDGGWDRKVKDWNLERVYNAVKKIQPYCAIGVNHTIELKEGSRKFALPDSMIVDNKYNFQYFPSDFRLWDPKIAHLKDAKQYLHKGQSYYLPFEHTVCLSKAWNWFQKSKVMETRDLDELQELFYWCTANGNTLVMNIPPDQTGRIRENEANTIIALGKRLNISPKGPLPKNGEFIALGARAEASSVAKNNSLINVASNAVDGGMQTAWEAADSIANLVVYPENSKAFNKITIFERCDMVSGPDYFSNVRTNRIQSYCIDIWKDNKWETIYISSEPMGDCKVILFPKEYKTEKVRLNILSAKGCPAINEFSLIHVK